MLLDGSQRDRRPCLPELGIFRSCCGIGKVDRQGNVSGCTNDGVMQFSITQIQVWTNRKLRGDD